MTTKGRISDQRPLGVHRWGETDASPTYCARIAGTLRSLAALRGGRKRLHVIESDEIRDAAALAVWRGRAVLLLRRGLLTSGEFILLRTLLGCVSGLCDPNIAIWGLAAGPDDLDAGMPR